MRSSALLLLAGSFSAVRSLHLHPRADAFDPFGFLGNPPEPSALSSTSPSASRVHTATLTSSTSLAPSSLSLSSTPASTSGSTTSVSATSPHSSVTSAPLPPGADIPSFSILSAIPSPTAPPNKDAASSSTTSWKIIGVTVIAFTTVAVIILGITFFEQWWSTFLRPILCLNKNKDLGEQLIPDWKRRSWRIGLEGPDDRYPSLASFSSILKQSPDEKVDPQARPVSPFTPRPASRTSIMCPDLVPCVAPIPPPAAAIHQSDGRYLPYASHDLGRSGSVKSARSQAPPAPYSADNEAAYGAAAETANPFDETLAGVHAR